MSMRMDADFWSARMAYLAKLAHGDALAVVLEVAGEGFVTYVADNLAADPWNGPAIAPVLRRAFDRRESSQIAGSFVLADGTTASVMGISPIVWNEQLIGALAALRTGPFDDREAAELARVADLVGLELAESTAARRADTQRVEVETRLRATSKIAELARKEKDPDQLLERATAQLAELFGADGVSIMLADDAGQLSVRSSVGLSDAAKLDRKNVGEGISGHVAKTGQPLLLSGQVRDARFVGNDPSISESIIAPLRSDEKTIGVVSIKHSALKDRYGQAQVESLTHVASEIADAFVAAEAMQRVEEDRHQALVLYELSRLATLGNDPQTDLETAAAMLGDTLGHDVVGVWQLEPDGGLRLRAGRGYGGLFPDLQSQGIGQAMSAALANRTVEIDRYPEGEIRRPDWASAAAVTFIVAPIGSHGNVLGVLVLGRKTGAYTRADMDFASALGEYLSGSIQKTAAGDAPEIVTANERRRIAQDLHDGIAQELTGVVLALEGTQRALERDPATAAVSLAKASRDARATLAEVRLYMSGLRANEGSTLHLPVTVARLVDDVTRQTGLRVDMLERGRERALEPTVERAVIRIVGESLRNVAQHAHATNAKLDLGYGDAGISITVEDDGQGFDPDAAVATAGHFGLVGMRERAESIGGTLVVLSRPGQGTIVKATMPYEVVAAAAAPEAPSVIEDVEPPAERSGILSKIFGR
jgi:signal transduction histidine kinase